MTPSPSLLIIDRVSRAAPLGICFHDVVSGRIVRDLDVAARAQDRPGPRIPLFPNPSGVYVLQNVPGLRDFEHGSGSETFWKNPPAPSTYIIEVSDPRRQFLPFTCQARVPTHKLFRWTPPPSLSPIEPDSAAVPLFSAPARTAPEGMAVLRAELFDPEANAPARWAIVEVAHAGITLGRGIADQRGCVAVLFGYPPPLDLIPDSPLVTGGPFAKHQWELTLRVRYAPTPGIAPGPGTVPEEFVETIPTEILNLEGALTQLAAPSATVWEVWNGPDSGQELAGAELQYGQELVVRSRDATTSDDLARLFVTPAA